MADYFANLRYGQRGMDGGKEPSLEPAVNGYVSFENSHVKVTRWILYFNWWILYFIWWVLHFIWWILFEGILRWRIEGDPGTQDGSWGSDLYFQLMSCVFKMMDFVFNVMNFTFKWWFKWINEDMMIWMIKWWFKWLNDDLND